MSKLPFRTRKKSSVSSCLCQVNSPFTFTNHHVAVVEGRDRPRRPEIPKSREFVGKRYAVGHVSPFFASSLGTIWGRRAGATRLASRQLWSRRKACSRHTSRSTERGHLRI